MKVIKYQTNNPFKTELVELDEPVLGGLFAVIAYRDGHEIHRKDGLNLDAAIEVYKTSVFGMNLVVYNANFDNF